MNFQGVKSINIPVLQSQLITHFNQCSFHLRHASHNILNIHSKHTSHAVKLIYSHDDYILRDQQLKRDGKKELKFC